MRTPKGFGRNYFTLSAIQAYNTQTLIQQCEARVHANRMQISESCDDEAEEELDDVLFPVSPTIPAHGGHCNCYFDRITRNRILENSTPRLFIATHKLTDSVSSPPF